MSTVHDFIEGDAGKYFGIPNSKFYKTHRSKI